MEAYRTKGSTVKETRASLQINAHQNNCDSHQQKKILENKYDNGSEQFMHVLNIIGHPCHQTSHGIARKKCNRKALDMFKQVSPSDHA